MVKAHIWNKFGVNTGMLCLQCLESRMNSRLKPHHFKDLEMNYDNDTILQFLLK